ncbi:hypothetical protein ACYPKM_04455 [Pseudomonas aeruginosa]
MASVGRLVASLPEVSRSEAFIEEAIREKDRLFGDSVELLLRRAGEDLVNLASILTLRNRRSGVGSSAMAMLCSLADEHRVRIFLMVSPFDVSEYDDLPADVYARIEQLNRDSMSYEQLATWYKSYGFRSTLDNEMVRVPRSRLGPMRGYSRRRHIQPASACGSSPG